MILLDYLKAVLLPSGRLPRSSFVAMIILLGAAHALLYKLALNHEADDIYGVTGGGLLLVLWMSFCVVSRRMHDLGRSNMLAAGLFLFSAIVFLAELDPRLLGKTEEAREYWYEIMAWLALLMRGAWFLISLELFKQEGEGGPNMYGQEFGTAGRSQVRHDRAQMAMADGFAAQRGVITAGRGVIEAAASDAPPPARKWTPVVPASPDAARRMRQPNIFVPG